MWVLGIDFASFKECARAELTSEIRSGSIWLLQLKRHDDISYKSDTDLVVFCIIS